MLRRWWQSWWTANNTPRDRLHFLLYTRTGCHLCAVAWERLQDWQRRYGFELAAVDVDGDPDLQARYGLHVPVVTVNGKVRFRGHVNPVLLRRLLEAERVRQ